jgi:hypothetical protein
LARPLERFSAAQIHQPEQQQPSAVAQARANKTFAQVTTEYLICTKQAGRQSATASLNAHAAKLNNLPIASIDEPLVLQSPSSAVH